MTMFIECTGRTGPDGRCTACGCRVETTAGNYVRANDGYTVSAEGPPPSSITWTPNDGAGSAEAAFDHAAARFEWGYLTTPK